MGNGQGRTGGGGGGGGLEMTKFERMCFMDDP